MWKRKKDNRERRRCKRNSKMKNVEEEIENGRGLYRSEEGGDDKGW